MDGLPIFEVNRARPSADTQMEDAAAEGQGVEPQQLTGLDRATSTREVDLAFLGPQYPHEGPRFAWARDDRRGFYLGREIDRTIIEARRDHDQREVWVAGPDPQRQLTVLLSSMLDHHAQRHFTNTRTIALAIALALALALALAKVHHRNPGSKVLDHFGQCGALRGIVRSNQQL
ncbi:hypothetical protein [Enhygromyxa salina]|uniref:hypothetical protein n=1 Tax=Enhygromyxa salina TaxID=215803 RepID=UPI0013FD07B6|nr:hypothetical protein [Enhygromyxa salina]